MGAGGGGRLTYFLVLNDGSKQDVATVLRAAVEFWLANLSARRLPSPFE
jgi:hypothetical protein